MLTTRCDDCEVEKSDEDYFTEVNPPGGYGRTRYIVCDDCMKEPRWDWWRARNWPNWPEPRK
jgi:hypothetical protein